MQSMVPVEILHLHQPQWLDWNENASVSRAMLIGISIAGQGKRERLLTITSAIVQQVLPRPRFHQRDEGSRSYRYVRREICSRS
jgi:hypothetical protein